ncbi:probable serine/threonine-protein kinase kinX [Mytilus californianus]|uniref:probable serine/threonine-protein kinase kinX n=1 Tax=Mytilus californianus TaxID=6549 RepID=UPI002247687D|nr:probable serine/threonine-protein kinase kinX [Mytilus californianus]
MNQIKTYSKSRPKSVAIQEKDDTIFDASESESDEDCNDDVEIQRINQPRRRSPLIGGSIMRPVKTAQCNRRNLKSTKKAGHQSTPLKRNSLEMPQHGVKRTMKNSANIKQMDISKDKGKLSKTQKERKKTKFSWSGSDESIELLRKDEGMTWQQKISFLLPKMHQEYVSEVPDIYKGKKEEMNRLLVNVSAEEITENPETFDDIDDDDSDEEEEDDENEYTYTYTWVTESATQTVQSTVPSSKKTSKTANSIQPYTENTSITHIEANSTGTSTLKKIVENNGRSRTGKLKLPDKPSQPTTVKSECEFIEKDKEGISFNQKLNSTIQKNAQNIKECGFPVDLSSIRFSQGRSKIIEKTPIQQREERTPTKQITTLQVLEELRAPSRPKKKKFTDKQLSSTKMFLSDHAAFVDMVPELSTINKVCGKSDDSIEMTREKSPFMKMCRTESPITPFISPKTDKEQVFTSTPTKDKNKEKEFPQFDLSSVQLPVFDEDELEFYESREVNSQEIVCESIEEDVDIPEPVVLERKPNNGKEASVLKDGENGTESTKISQNSTVTHPKDLNNNDGSKNNSVNDGNISVVPLNMSLEVKTKPVTSNKSKSKDRNKEQCCIVALNIPVKPIKMRSTCNIDYKEVLRNTPVDCIQAMLY